MPTPVIISILGGIVIELFFQLVKYRDDLNKNAPQPIYASYATGYMPLYQPIGYMSVVDFLSGGKRRWGVYYLFRLFPPFAILILLSAILGRYFSIANPLPYLLIASTLSLIFRDGAMLFMSKFISEKLLYLTNIIATYCIAAVITILAMNTDITFIAPSVSGLFDNLWSTLLVAAIVLLYSRITNPRAKTVDIQAEQTARDNYIFESYKKIKTKHSGDIDRAITLYATSKPILYAVLIYENMNRPAWMRLIENVIVKTTHKELTVGIAQVKSDRALTDSESISKAARILQGSSFADSGYGSGFVDIQQLEGILEKYNSSSLYAESIAEIMATLRRCTTDVFPFNYGNIERF